MGFERARHRAGAGRGDRRGRAADRLRLDGRGVREHPRPGGGRDLQPRRRGLPVLLRGDQVPLPPGGTGPDREGCAGRDRAARRGLRPGRPLRDRQHHRPDADREAEDADVPRDRLQPRARGRRRRRHPARPRPGRGGGVLRPRRPDREDARPDREGGRDLGPQGAQARVAGRGHEAGDPDRAAGRKGDGVPAQPARADPHARTASRTGPPTTRRDASWATRRATWTPACARRWPPR